MESARRDLGDERFRHFGVVRLVVAGVLLGVMKMSSSGSAICLLHFSNKAIIPTSGSHLLAESGARVGAGPLAEQDGGKDNNCAAKLHAVEALPKQQPA